MGFIEKHSYQERGVEDAWYSVMVKTVRVVKVDVVIHPRLGGLAGPAGSAV